MDDTGEERSVTPSVPGSNGDLMDAEPSRPGEPQTEEELERLIDKELEDVGKGEVRISPSFLLKNKLIFSKGSASQNQDDKTHFAT